MECGRLVSTTALFPIYILYENFSFVGFITITASLPSVFIKAVVSNCTRLEELMILFAPGRMNFEK